MTALQALHVCTEAVVALTTLLHANTLPLVRDNQDANKSCVTALEMFMTRLEGLMVRLLTLSRACASGGSCKPATHTPLTCIRQRVRRWGCWRLV
jgi:hypothetical protein